MDFFVILLLDKAEIYQTLRLKRDIESINVLNKIKIQKLELLGVDRTSQSSVPVRPHLYSLAWRVSNLPQGPQAQVHGEKRAFLSKPRLLGKNSSFF